MALATPEERLAALAARKEYEKTQANQITPAPTPTQQPALNTEQQTRLDEVKSSPVYQDMIKKWLTDEQITKAVQWYNTMETQSIPQAEIKPATQTTPTAPTQADTKKTNEITPTSLYLDDSEERQQTIISNLNAATINNPNSLKDQKSFRDFYNYAGRSDLQKKTLDTRFSWYQKWQDLSYKSANDIYSAYDSNNITISDLNNLKLTNPAKYEEVNALIDKKTKLATYSQDLYWITETVNPFQSIIDSYTKWLQTLSASNFYNDYKEAMNSAAIKEQKLAIADKTTEIEKLDKEINEKKREVEKRYEGTGATRGKINAIVADELESLYSMRSNLTIDINWAISKYNAEAGAIREDFEMKQAEQQFNMQQRQQQMSELGFAMQLMSYETPKQQDERAWNKFIRQQEYTDWNIYSNDPKTRQKAVEKAVDRVLTEFQWIPMVRSREQMVSDIQRMVESGSDLWDAITENIRKPIMNKPEYKKIMSDKFGVKYDQNVVEIWGKNYIQTKDESGRISLKPFVDEWASVKTGDYKYSKIDLGNWQVVGTGQTVNFNGTDYKITQLWGSMTGWIDLYSSNRVIWAFEWWTVVGQWVDKAIDWYSPNRYIEILWDNGYVYRYNHLKEAGDWYQTYAIWTKVAQWQQIWIMWNTGKVRSASGWDWTHLDLAVYSGDRATNKNVSPLDIKEQTRILFGAWGQPVATDISWTLTERANILRSTMSKQARDSFDEALKNAWWDATLTENIIKDMEIDKYYDRIKDPLNDYQKAEEPLKEINNAFSRIDAVWQSYKADPKSITSKNALDQVLVVWLNKILDPWSVVRESEFARAPEWMSFFNKWEWKIAKIQEWWVWLTDSERNEIINAVTLMKKWQQSAINTYKNDLLLAWKTLNVPESFIYGMIWWESKFSTDNMQPQIDSNIYFWNLINTTMTWGLLEQYNIDLSNYN